MKLQKNKTCKTCGAWKRVYTKFYCRMWKEKIFYCTKRETVTDSDFTCGKWKKRDAKADISFRKLDEAEEDVLFLLKAVKKIERQ